ncbi:major facilitator superfamily domain-containing protein, partial [Cunninghamella echinulata]
EEEQIDGGYGWFIVLAAFLVQMTGIGCITSVMQDYYQQHTFGSSPSVIFQLNLVGATANSIMNLMSLLSQIILSRFGSKCGIFIACLCCSFGLELASLSTELWHLLLTQGLLFGIGCSIIFYVSMSVIPQWFNKREGIALGLASSGSCIGGLVMPFIMTPLNRQLGASWCYRILGFINLAIGIIACILFKDRKITNEATKNNKKNKNIKDIIDFSVLKNMDLIIWCIADTFIEAGYYVPYFFLPSYATHLGLSDSQGSLLVSIASVCNAFGRIIAGHIGDKIGYINTTIFSCLITSSSCFFLWTFAFDFTKLMLFAILFGTFGGIFIAQGASITRIVTGKEKFETGYAMFLLLTVIAMYGPNLSTFIETSLLHHHNTNPYFSYKLFTAFCYMIGSIFLIYLKLKLSK